MSHLIIPASPWRPVRHQPLVHNELPRRVNYSEKLYECVWDVGVNGTILSLMNAVAIFAFSMIRKENPFSLSRGVLQAGMTTFTFLSCVEGWHLASGKNMRKAHYVSLEKIGALFLAAVITPLITYSYDKFFGGRTIEYMPLLGFSIYDTLGLIFVSSPYF